MTIEQLTKLLEQSSKYDNKAFKLQRARRVTRRIVGNDISMRIGYVGADGLPYGVTLWFPLSAFEEDKHPLQLNLGRAEDDR